MKINICILFLFVIALSFKTKEEKVNAIKLISIFPNFNFSNGKIDSYDTSFVYIFNYKNIEIHKMTYRYDSIFDDKFISHNYTHYFVHNKVENWGFDYDERKDFIGNKVSVDSIFKHQWFTQNKVYPMFGKSNEMKLLSSYQSKDLDTLKESYSLKSNIYSYVTAQIFVEYCKSKPKIDFSLSRELDSIKNMTLFKLRIAFDPMKVSDTFTMDKYETYYEIQNLELINKNEIFNYIEKFNHDSHLK